MSNITPRTYESLFDSKTSHKGRKYLDIIECVILIPFGTTAGLYYALNTFNNCIYIGEGSSVEQRVRDHIRQLCTGKHINKGLQRDWNDFGSHHFEFGLLTTCEGDAYERRRLEQIFMHAYQTKNPIYGYNSRH